MHFHHCTFHNYILTPKGLKTNSNKNSNRIRFTSTLFQADSTRFLSCLANHHLRVPRMKQMLDACVGNVLYIKVFYLYLFYVTFLFLHWSLYRIYLFFICNISFLLSYKILDFHWECYTFFNCL